MRAKISKILIVKVILSFLNAQKAEINENKTCCITQ